ncbi:MAG: hypothetical protein MR508_01220 [Lachnospiraceae bacterium]|nr:hypothetical protein [Lachnospiraceae bacterium]
MSYEDILYLPHHQSPKREHMSLRDRAAQFAPFSALNGYEDAIKETGRLTDEEILLDETAVDRINEQLQYLAAHMDEGIRVSVTYFRPDDRKSGGAYLTDIGVVKKFDHTGHVLVMESGVTIAMGQIRELEIV